MIQKTKMEKGEKGFDGSIYSDSYHLIVALFIVVIECWPSPQIFYTVQNTMERKA